MARKTPAGAGGSRTIAAGSRPPMRPRGALAEAFRGGTGGPTTPGDITRPPRGILAPAVGRVGVSQGAPSGEPKGPRRKAAGRGANPGECPVARDLACEPDS